MLAAVVAKKWRGGENEWSVLIFFAGLRGDSLGRCPIVEVCRRNYSTGTLSPTKVKVKLAPRAEGNWLRGSMS